MPISKEINKTLSWAAQMSAFCAFLIPYLSFKGCLKLQKGKSLYTDSKISNCWLLTSATSPDLLVRAAILGLFYLQYYGPSSYSSKIHYCRDREGFSYHGDLATACKLLAKVQIDLWASRYEMKNNKM